ncbi:carbohydrate ABC transporter permease [Microlunatus capsulatus]|uniref:Multiple sugar transport system permease protein/sn-glycerol 3-phosphate transport system permease protein n=1 Tax=Microlunatus capsulatus TaxID=99117 RepID=A0ABS4ZBK5_9ACTN|nr:carbohydrate ABC transporter permease [Microlunatus capsulatus]MBP2417568.1 multiple sugar transport system permease protein/sn-glycerol 3-phosphate transport system permease protein [Microlunatus capsulatus]
MTTTTRPVQATPRRRPARGRLGRWSLVVVLSLGCFVVLLPVVWMVLTSLKTSDQVFVNPPLWLFTPQWHNYVEVLTLVPFQRYILNTATIVGFVVLGTLLSCSFCAYGFARLRAPGRNAIFFVLMATLMLPTTVTLVPTYIVFNNLGWLNTFKPLILPAFFGSAFFVFLFRQFFLGIPKELEEAARIDGAGYLRIWWTIFMPLSWPVIATVSVFTFVGAYNDFFGPVIYLSEESKYTIAVALSYFSGSPRIGPQMHLTMAATTIAALPSVVVFLLAQRQFVRGITVSGINK